MVGGGEEVPGTALFDLGHVELEEAIEPGEELLPRHSCCQYAVVW